MGGTYANSRVTAMRLQCRPWLILLLTCSGSGLGIHAFRVRSTQRRAVISTNNSRAEHGKFLKLVRDDALHTGLPSLSNITDHPPRAGKLMDAITKMQVETCVHMKKLYSEEFDAFKRCLELLSKLCKPGDDLKMDGDNHEKPTGEGFCKGFFGFKKKVKEQAKERAVECVKVSKKQDKNTDEYKSCHKYMVRLCDPGEDLLMDGDEKENPSGKGYCQEFFPNKEKGNQTEKGDVSGKGNGKKAKVLAEGKEMEQMDFLV